MLTNRKISVQMFIIYYASVYSDAEPDQTVEDDKCEAYGHVQPPLKTYKGKGKGRESIHKVDDIDWVQCDTCQYWYHCLSLNAILNNLPEHYTCPNCLPS